MNCLITGGAGFIGSHLAEALLAEGHNICVIDDLSTGREANIAHLRGHRRFRFVRGTVCDPQVLAPLVAAADEIYHLAAVVGVRLVVEHPIHTIRTNVEGTEVVLRLAAPSRKRIIITSTSEVYGKGINGKLREDDDMLLGPTTHARWCYACSKALDEFLALAYWREHHLPVTIARLFNTVGPRQVGTYGMVLPRFVQQALAGGPITVYDDGQMVRCFAHVSDVVRALVQLNRHPQSLGQVFNVGSEEPVTILELAERVRACVGNRARIEHIPYEKAYEAGFEDIRHRVPDTTKLRNLTGFRPEYDLNRIIESVVTYYRHQSSAATLPVAGVAERPRRRPSVRKPAHTKRHSRRGAKP